MTTYTVEYGDFLGAGLGYAEPRCKWMEVCYLGMAIDIAKREAGNDPDLLSNGQRRPWHVRASDGRIVWSVKQRDSRLADAR